MSGLLADGTGSAHQQPLAWRGQDPQHRTSLVWTGGNGEPIDAQGACSCGWNTESFDEYASFSQPAPAPLPPGRSAERDPLRRAAQQALAHGRYSRLEHARQVRQLAAIVAERGLEHREALEAELAAYDQMGMYLDPNAP